MKDLSTSCRKMDAKLADLLLEPESASAEVHEHVANCDGCRAELESLKAAMGLMDAWQAPEPSPFFLTRLKARLREERDAQPAGWLSRARARLSYGPRRVPARPLAAMALTVMLLLGGGTYLSLSKLMQPPAQMGDAAVVNDLQILDNNAQVLNTLEDLSTPAGDGD